MFEPSRMEDAILARLTPERRQELETAASAVKSHDQETVERLRTYAIDLLQDADLISNAQDANILLAAAYWRRAGELEAKLG